MRSVSGDGRPSSEPAEDLANEAKRLLEPFAKKHGLAKLVLVYEGEDGGPNAEAQGIIVVKSDADPLDTYYGVASAGAEAYKEMSGGDLRNFFQNVE